ncbi:heterokaryon incompatibility protein-domain-containing protein [Clohesyomyces aquaticus]|uniref:Heterokaryon incompatibility protein-domain-containing protein n=1 Tax=Clohesyomyces aquaticus TaxID=1231657 RepID=A0A1Y1ZFR6_9PLEO|nr:heterokaryon incompatibility protein-domain-containing protein [Clohesyomyces aquaticus]
MGWFWRQETNASIAGRDSQRWDQNPYQYQCLTGKHEIRLLVLYPGSFEDPLQGDIIRKDLRRKPAYDALSYTWADETGDANRSKVIRSPKDNSFINITKSCEAALRRLRFPRASEQKRRVWVDAVCINQDDYQERNHQVSLMSQIYMNARQVIAYTGEGTPRTDHLFDWLNGLDAAHLIVPSSGTLGRIDITENDILPRSVQSWNVVGHLREWAINNAIKLEWYYRIGRARVFMPFQTQGPMKEQIVVPEAALVHLVSEYFSRRWFKRVWVLQEVSLPDLNKTKFMCGTKTTTAERALHLVSLLKNRQSSVTTGIFHLLRRRIKGPRTSYLLDILIETRGRECEDPRDKIFGVLSISQWMDGGKFPQLKANYEDPACAVYMSYSAFFIKLHGPAFFLSLIKSPPRLRGLSSWAADWTVPWPNYNSVRGIDFAARSRIRNDKDTVEDLEVEDGQTILRLLRPRILRGYFTRDGHIDGSNTTHIETVQSLKDDEVLIEMYPGVAAFLKKAGEFYIFLRVCPHALSESEVEDLVTRWSRVVVYLEGPERHVCQGTKSLPYLSCVQTFKIR